MGQTTDFFRSVAAWPKRAVSKLLKPKTRIEHFGAETLLHVERERIKSGSKCRDHSVRFGPNMVHVFVTHEDGSIEHESMGRNLMTYIGQNVLAGLYGFEPAGATLASYISSAVDASSITTTGTVLTASNLATPQMGCAGLRVYAAPHTTTLPVVWGNVISNTTSKINIDKWWKYAAGAGGVPITGTTPTVADSFVLAPGGAGGVNFMALSTASSVAATDTTLASEITTNNLARSMATYAHSFSASSFLTLTVQVIFSPSGTQTGIASMGLFVDATANSGGPVIFENTFASTNVLSTDTLTVTDTITVSG